MHFPKYWAKGKTNGTNAKGAPMEIESWGWSDNSMDEARQLAMTRAQATVQRIRQMIPGQRRQKMDYYADRPSREPVLEDVSGKAVKAVITRNSFGCDVLNTDLMAFADLDYARPRNSLTFWQRLTDFSGKLAEGLRQTWETETISRLKAWQSSRSGWSFRLYRTKGGLRVLVTSRLVQAESSERQTWLESIGSDPLYRRLCVSQKSFRARLTPKPWRANFHDPRVRFPYDTPKAQQTIEKWLLKYREHNKGFAVCEFIENVGSSAQIPELSALITLHDTRTCSPAKLPLA
jgi:hypothetical protein